MLLGAMHPEDKTFCKATPLLQIGPDPYKVVAIVGLNPVTVAVVAR